MINTEQIRAEVQAFITDGVELVRKEVQLAKAEINEKVNQAQTGIVSLVTGALVGFAGLIFLGHAAVAWLTAFTSPAVAALIVALVLLVISMIMISIAKTKLSSEELKPRRTIHAARNIADEFGGKKHAK